MTEKKFKIQAPMGTIMVPKDVMTESELRKFMPQLIQDPEVYETWKAKAAEDPIEEIIEWLRRSGFVITEVK